MDFAQTCCVVHMHKKATAKSMQIHENVSLFSY